MIKLVKGSYVNRKGEQKSFVEVHGTDKPATRLLTKKKDDGTRMSPEETSVFLKEKHPDWRDRLEYVESEDYGDYFVINLLDITYEDMDCFDF